MKSYAQTHRLSPNIFIAGAYFAMQTLTLKMIPSRSATRQADPQTPGLRRARTPGLSPSRTPAPTPCLTPTQMPSQLKKYRTMVRELQALLKQSRLQVQQLQQKLKVLGQRSVAREQQFYKILTRLAPEVTKYMDSNNDEVLRIFQQIFDNFQKSNQATSTFIQHRYQQNMRTMENKLTQIMAQFERQFSKLRRITSADTLNIQKTIDEALRIARLVEEDNMNLRRKYQQEAERARLLREERELLLQDLVRRKRMVDRLYLEKKEREGREGQGESRVDTPAQSKLPVSQANKQGASVLAAKQDSRCPPSRQPSQQSNKKPYVRHTRAKSTQNQFLTQSECHQLQSHQFSHLSHPAQTQPSPSAPTITLLKSTLAKEHKRNRDLSRTVDKMTQQNQQVSAALRDLMAVLGHSAGGIGNGRVLSVIEGLKGALSGGSVGGAAGEEEKPVGDLLCGRCRGVMGLAEMEM